MAKKKDPLKNFKDRMRKIRNSLISKKSLDDIGEKAADMVRERTRLGYGLKDKDSFKQKKLEKLSPKYKAFRKNNKPAGPSTPAKSNLTYTGKMLDDITHKVEGTDNDGRTVQITITNEESKEKAEWVSEDRPFMGLTDAQIKELKIWMGKNMRKYTKKK